MLRGRILYDAGLAGIVASVVTVVGVAGSAAQMLSGGPPAGPVGPVPDRTDAYLTGTWHLGQAVGRAACHEGPITAQLRSLTVRDLEWAQRGMDAQIPCNRGGRLAVIQGLAIATDTIGQLRSDLNQARDEYAALPSSTGCWSGDEQTSLRATATAIHALSTAAATTRCAIATWRDPLPPSLREQVARDVAAARSSALAIRERSLRDDLVRGLDDISSRLELASGEQTFQDLAAAHERVLAAMRKTP